LASLRKSSVTLSGSDRRSRVAASSSRPMDPVRDHQTLTIWLARRRVGWWRDDPGSFTGLSGPGST
jgi:hypothetical protein